MIARCCCYNSLLMFCMISLMLFMFVRCERERERRGFLHRSCVCVLYRKIQTLSQPAYQHYSRICALRFRMKRGFAFSIREVRCAMQSQQQQVCCTGEVIPEVCMYMLNFFVARNKGNENMEVADGRLI